MTEEITLEQLDIEYLSVGELMYSETDCLKIALKEMNDYDRYIMLLYVHFHSLRKVGEMIGMSHSKVSTEIKRIRGIIGDKELYR